MTPPPADRLGHGAAERRRLLPDRRLAADGAIGGFDEDGIRLGAGRGAGSSGESRLPRSPENKTPTPLPPKCNFEQDAGGAGNVAGIEERDANARRRIGRHAIFHQPDMPQHGRDLPFDDTRRTARPSSAAVAPPKRLGNSCIEQVACSTASAGHFLAGACSRANGRKATCGCASACWRDSFAHVQWRDGAQVESQQHSEHGRGKGRGGFGHVDRPGESPLDQQRQPAEVIGVGMGQKQRGHRFHARGQALGYARALGSSAAAERGLSGRTLLGYRAAVDHPSAVARIEHVQGAGDFARRTEAGGGQLAGRGRIER